MIRNPVPWLPPNVAAAVASTRCLAKQAAYMFNTRLDCFAQDPGLLRFVVRLHPAPKVARAQRRVDLSRLGKPLGNPLLEYIRQQAANACIPTGPCCGKMLAKSWSTGLRHYDEISPHSAIGNIPPNTFANLAGEINHQCKPCQKPGPERSKVV